MNMKAFSYLERQKSLLKVLKINFRPGENCASSDDENTL